MELKLIQPPNNKDKTKTEFKIPIKEFKNNLWLRRWLKLAGADLNKPQKKSSRYVYFVVDGDYLNGKLN